MLLLKAVGKKKAPNPGDCHGIGASSFPFGNIISPCVSIICIRFNGYNLSLLQKRWRWAPPLESIVRVSDGKYTPLFLFFRHFLHETATLSAFFVLTLSRDRRASLPAGPVSVRIFKKRFR